MFKPFMFGSGGFNAGRYIQQNALVNLSPNAPNTLWQDTGKNVASAIGTIVRVMSSASGNGYDAVAPSDAESMIMARMPLGGITNRLAVVGANSEDLTSSGWGADVSANSTETATTLELTGTDDAYFYKTIDLPYDITGIVFTLSVTVQAVSGANTGIALRFTAPGSATTQLIDISDGLEHTFDLTDTGSMDGALNLGIDNRSGVTPGVNTAPTKIVFTKIQLTQAASAASYQKVTATYDVTQSGVASVIWLDNTAGTGYYTIPGSDDITCLHDGTGGDAFLNVYVNKVDDAANDYFFSSRITSTDVGQSLAILDATTDNGKLSGRISNGAADIIALDSANSAVARFDNLTLNTSYFDPAYAATQNAVSVLSGNDTGTPSTSGSTYDIAIGAGGDGNNILPGYFGAFIVIPNLTPTERAAIINYQMAQIG